MRLPAQGNVIGHELGKVNGRDEWSDRRANRLPLFM